MPQNTQSQTGGGVPAAPTVQTPATVESTHQMIVAIAIFFVVGMFALIVSGQSKTSGNVIAGILAIALVVQGITHVNPFVSFLTTHPLTPTTKTS